MGRTNATYRDLLRALENRWGTYRRGLRREDQAHFDRLFTHARNHADASGLQNHEDPIVPALVSIALAQEKQLAALEERVEDQRTALDALEARVESSESASGDASAAGAAAAEAAETEHHETAETTGQSLPPK